MKQVHLEVDEIWVLKRMVQGRLLWLLKKESETGEKSGYAAKLGEIEKKLAALAEDNRKAVEKRVRA